MTDQSEGIMFAKLPEKLKQQVKNYLEENNFPAAKLIYDEWLNHQLSETAKKAKMEQKKPIFTTSYELSH